MGDLSMAVLSAYQHVSLAFRRLSASFLSKRHSILVAVARSDARVTECDGFQGNLWTTDQLAKYGMEGGQACESPSNAHRFSPASVSRFLGSSRSILKFGGPQVVNFGAQTLSLPPPSCS